MSKFERVLIREGYSLRLISQSGNIQEKVYQKEGQTLYLVSRNNKLLYKIFESSII